MSLIKSLVHAGRIASYRNASLAIGQSQIIGWPRWMCDNMPQHDKQYFDGLVKSDKVVVFMKGVPEQPMCGFSNAVVQILRMHGVDDYKYHNVLDDQHIRQGIKSYSDWPTIPQVYMNGEFVGGCDILLQMHREGDLIEKLNEIGIRSALLDKDDNEVTN